MTATTMLALAMMMTMMIMVTAATVGALEVGGACAAKADWPFAQGESAEEESACIELPRGLDGSGPENGEAEEEEEVVLPLRWDKAQLAEFAAARETRTGVARELVEEHVRRRTKLVRFRREEALAYWRDRANAPDCLVAMHACFPFIGFAKLSNAGLGPVHETDQGHATGLDAAGETCFVIGQPLVHRALFQAAQPRTLVIDTRLGPVVDFAAARALLPADGKLVLLGSPSPSTLAGARAQEGLCVLRDAQPLIAVPIDGATRCPGDERQPRLAKSFVVNMDEDKETRWPAIQRAFQAADLDQALPPLERFRALNGATDAALTEERRALFRFEDLANAHNPYEDHGLRPGVLGCALSHIVLWAMLAKRGDFDDLDAVLVLEDDARFAKDAAQLWRQGAGHPLVWADPRWDILMIGFAKDPFFHPAASVWDNVQIFSPRPRSAGKGTHGYILRKRGALRLLQAVRERGMPQPVDWFLMEAWGPRSEIVAYKSVPRIVLDGEGDAFESRTTASYPLSRVASCVEVPASGAAKAEPAVAGLRVEVVDADNPAAATDGGTLEIHPDGRLKASLTLAAGTDSDIFARDHRCTRVCFQINHADFARPAQCRFLFDEHAFPSYLDPAKVVQGRENQVYAALIDASGTILSNTVTGPLTFTVAAAPLALEASYSLSGGQLAVQAHVARAPEDFHSKHSTALLCVAASCAPLVALPWQFSLARSRSEIELVTISLRALGDDREIAPAIVVEIQPGPDPLRVIVTLQVGQN